MIIDKSLVGELPVTAESFESHWFEEAKVEGVLIFDEINFTKFTFFSEALKGIKLIEFENCVFNKTSIRNLKKIEKLVFKNNNIIRDLTLSSVESELLVISNDNENNNSHYNLSIVKSKLNVIRISHFAGFIYSELLVTHHMYLMDLARIRMVDIRSDSTIRKSLVFDNVRSLDLDAIQDFNLSIINSKCNFKGSGLIIDNLHLKNSTISDSTLSRVGVIEEFNLLDSELSYVKLIGCKLQSNETILEGSKLNSIKIDKDTLLPIELESETEEENLLGYEQLKAIAKENGKLFLVDHYDKNRLISNYRIRKMEVNRLPFFARIDFWVTYSLPYITSRFNYEFRRPVVLFMLLIHPLGVVLTLYIMVRECSFQEMIEIFKRDYFELYFHTILPFHQIDFSETLSINKGVSFVMKVYSSYFIYQIVTASRKLIRRAEEV